MSDFGAPAGTFPPPPVPPPPPSGPFGERTGPPWEQSGPAVQRFIDTAKGALLDPATTFRNMRREGGLANPLVYYLIGGLFLVLSQAIWSGLGMNPMGRGMPAGLLAVLLFGACYVVAIVFIGSGITHVMLMLLGGAKYPYETTFRTFAYAQGSALPIAIIPFCGGIIGGVWALVVYIIGLSQTQEISTGKAAAAVLIPAIVCCGLIMIVAIVAGIGMATMLNRS